MKRPRATGKHFYVFHGYINPYSVIFRKKRKAWDTVDIRYSRGSGHPQPGYNSPTPYPSSSKRISGRECSFFITPVALKLSRSREPSNNTTLEKTLFRVRTLTNRTENVCKYSKKSLITKNFFSFIHCCDPLAYQKAMHRSVPYVQVAGSLPDSRKRHLFTDVSRFAVPIYFLLLHARRKDKNIGRRNGIKQKTGGNAPTEYSTTDTWKKYI